MKNLLAWVDDRTGCLRLGKALFYENIPGGARWRYVWGTTVLFCFLIQAITGLFLWMTYSPSAQTAWESVYFVQYQMTGGWFLRGLHHYTADVMNVVVLLHLMQIIIDGAYTAPREFNFWVAMGLLIMSLALSFTGYLLPWDQRGFCASRVATSIMGITPVVGAEIRQIALGGTEYGHHTLTRFFALHAGLLPAVMVTLLFLQAYLLRRHGRKIAVAKSTPDSPAWPDQALKDAMACLTVLVVVLFLVFKPRLSGEAPGAHLGAPADPSDPFASYGAARPEWYFLFLFQFLKYFPGSREIWGAIVIPGILLTIVAAMPWIGQWKLGRRFNLGFICAVLTGMATLTGLAIAEDHGKPEYQAAVKAAHAEADRAKELAGSLGIPIGGAATLLRNDPMTQGPKLFARHCASCHRYDGTDGTGKACDGQQCAADLKGFASREWLAGLLDPRTVASTNYLGGTIHKGGDMVKYVRNSIAAFSPEKKAQLEKITLALSAEAQLGSQRELDVRDASLIQEGHGLLTDGKLRCTQCHQFGEPDEKNIGPDLTGYGSRDWLIKFIANPAHPRFYGAHNDRMPKYGDDQLLDVQAIALIADWLRGEGCARPASHSFVYDNGKK